MGEKIITDSSHRVHIALQRRRN